MKLSGSQNKLSSKRTLDGRFIGKKRGSAESKKDKEDNMGVDDQNIRRYESVKRIVDLNERKTLALKGKHFPHF